jgi:predicted flap endonuclease-1-like 5' DNA nuclease
MSDMGGYRVRVSTVRGRARAQLSAIRKERLARRRAASDDGGAFWIAAGPPPENLPQAEAGPVAAEIAAPVPVEQSGDAPEHDRGATAGPAAAPELDAPAAAGPAIKPLPDAPEIPHESGGTRTLPLLPDEPGTEHAVTRETTGADTREPDGTQGDGAVEVKVVEPPEPAAVTATPDDSLPPLVASSDCAGPSCAGSDEAGAASSQASPLDEDPGRTAGPCAAPDPSATLVSAGVHVSPDRDQSPGLPPGSAEPAAAANPQQSDLHEIAGIGPGLVWMFNSAGVASLADLARADAQLLSERLGMISRLLDLDYFVAQARDRLSAKG